MLRSHCFSAARLRLGKPAKTSLWNRNGKANGFFSVAILPCVLEALRPLWEEFL